MNTAPAVQTAINAGAGNDQIHVWGTSTGSNTTVSPGAGNNTIEIGSPGQGLAHIHGTVTISGGAGVDTLNFNDRANSVGVTTGCRLRHS